MVKTLKIYALGGLRTTADDQLLTGTLSRKAEVILAYLALRARPFTRTELALIFWPDSDEDQGRRNLRKLLSEMRKRVGRWVTIDRHTVVFDTAASHWIDVRQVEAGLALLPDDPGEAIPVGQTETVAAAVAHYEGDLLLNVYLGDAPQFESWLALARERLRLQVEDALFALARHYLHRGAYTDGIHHARRLVLQEPLREDGQRLLLRLYLRAGRRYAALRQYQRFVQNLEEMVGVSPEPATQRLAARMRHTADFLPAHLPHYPTEFVGRSEELALLERYLDRSGKRPLVTLVGAGGVGKTRLAVEVARRRQADYLHGVVLVPLAAVDAVAQVPAALTIALGLPPSDRLTAKEQLLSYLRDREMLLVLDNVEQLVPDIVPLMQALLTTCPDLSLLVTSQRRLSLQAEWLVPIDYLACPPPTAVTPAEIEMYPAAELLLGRARRVAPQAALSPAGVGAICRLVDGLPLALELAAAALADHTVPDLLAAVRRNVDVLATQMHDMPVRHRSVRAVFDYTWQHLTAVEQNAWARLSMLRGAFDTAAAQAVAAASPGLVERLAQKSILQARHDDRYTIHPLLRHFARQTLGADESAAVQATHSTYFLARMARLADRIRTAALADTLAEMARINVDVRAAWRYAVRTADTAALVAAAVGMADYYRLRGPFAAGLALLAEGAAVGSHDDPAWQRPFAYGRLLLLHAAGRQEQAQEIAGRLAAELDASAGGQYEVSVAAVYKLWGLTCYRLGERETAVAHLQTGLAAARAAGDTFEEGDILSHLAYIYYMRSEFARSRDLHQQALPLHAAAGNVPAESASLITLGNLYLHEENYTAARDRLQQALDVAERSGILRYRARAHYSLAIVNHLVGDYGSALRDFQLAQDIYAQLGDHFTYTVVDMGLAIIWQQCAQPEIADSYYADAEEGLRQLDSVHMLDWLHANRSALYLFTGRPDRMAAELAQITCAVQDEQLCGLVNYLQGRLALQEQKWDAAVEAFTIARKYYEELGLTARVLEMDTGILAAAVGRSAPEDEVRAQATAVWMALQAFSHLRGVEDPAWMYAVCAQAWTAVGQSETAEAVVTAGRMEVERRAATLPEEELARVYRQAWCRRYPILDRSQVENR